MLLSLFFSVICLASDAKEIWSVSYLGERPKAAFFDAGSGAIYVSVSEGNGRARLDRVSLEGKIEKRGMASTRGEPGPIRAFDGKIYWVAGSGSIQIIDPKGARSSVQGVPDFLLASEIAVYKNGAVYLAYSKSLYRILNGKAEKLREGKAITGMFLYLDQLFLLEGGNLISISLPMMASEPERREKKISGIGLERTSTGQWLTVQGGKVLLNSSPILTLKAEIGHPAYVFRMNTAEDFFVLPLTDQGILRAYRMPGERKAKKTDK